MRSSRSWIWLLPLIVLLAGWSVNDSTLAGPVASGQAEPGSQPVVLDMQGLRPYIAACIENQARISKEFGAFQIDFSSFSSAMSEDESAYSPRCQGFLLPDGQTFFAFDTLSVAGAVIFESATRKIVTILPWSGTLTQNSRDEVVFDRTFYRIRQSPIGAWQITALVFAIFGDKYSPRYETWEFRYSPRVTDRAESRNISKRYTMQPFRR